MHIRNATYKDAPSIKILLDVLGYKTSTILLITQLEKCFGREDHQVFVYESDKQILGFIAAHYLPQLGFYGDLVTITYFLVDESAQGTGIGKALEEHVAAEAWKRKCDRIQVQVLDWRTPVHQFYIQQGYQEYPKYFTKRLIYAE